MRDTNVSKNLQTTTRGSLPTETLLPILISGCVAAQSFPFSFLCFYNSTWYNASNLWEKKIKMLNEIWLKIWINDARSISPSLPLSFPPSLPPSLTLPLLFNRTVEVMRNHLVLEAWHARDGSPDVRNSCRKRAANNTRTKFCQPHNFAQT